jgi:hypothetical protein
MGTIFIYTIAIALTVIVLLYVRWMRQQLRAIRRCTHPRLIESRWVEEDGTCMVRHLCPDCDFYDCGHVHANPETWANEP